jgi:putative aldouronate transport system permease protein
LLKISGTGERIYLASVYLFLVFVFMITFYPFWNVVVLSFNTASDTVRGGIMFWPREFSLESYVKILQDQEILSGLRVTVLRTIVGPPLTLLVVSLLAYALSKKDLLGRRPIALFFVFTMYFYGGLIPQYMIYKSIHIIDTFGVFIFPNLLSVFYVLIVRTFMQDLPAEMEESAKIDGANDLQVFWKVILPVCVPVLVTIGMLTAISQWNQWFDSYVFTDNPNLKTMQAVLVKILNQFQTKEFTNDNTAALANSVKRIAVSSDTIRMSATVVATLPIIMVYPFLQRYIVKGLTLGAVKS